MHATDTVQISVLHGHESPETAHLTFTYPFGNNRCVRREWIERAIKGAGKGQYRFVTQTTVRPFNYEYTQKLESLGEAAANTWATALIQSSRGASIWNKPHAGTYYDLAIMVTRPLEDNSGRIGVSYESLSAHSGPDQFAKFQSDFHTTETGWTLDAAQCARFHDLLRYSQRSSPQTWTRWETDHGPLPTITE